MRTNSCGCTSLLLSYIFAAGASALRLSASKLSAAALSSAAAAAAGINEAPKGTPFVPSSQTPPVIGLLGLGKMGVGMMSNMLSSGVKVHAFDLSPAARDAAAAAGATVHSSAADVLRATADSTAAEASAPAHTPIVSMLPNDAAVNSLFRAPEGDLVAVGEDATSSAGAPPLLHISSSTISPATSAALSAAHAAVGQGFVGAPVFARPDGVTAKQASFVMGGDAALVDFAGAVLGTSTGVFSGGPSGLFYFGANPGAGNVVKLAGNFLIASTIESLSEACALAENHGVEREAVVSMLTSTIFDCLIYKGYGQRVGERDHQPGGFALNLGKKDVSLVLAAADAVAAPMPIASLLRDRFLSAQAAGWGDFDWSAIGMKVSADAGVDVSSHVQRVQQQIDEAAAGSGEKQ